MTGNMNDVTNIVILLYPMVN